MTGPVNIEAKSTLDHPAQGSGRYLTVLIGMGIAITMVIMVIVGWRVVALKTTIAENTQTTPPRLAATYNVSSDLTAVRILTSQLATRETLGEVKTSYESLLSREERIKDHLNILRASGIAGSALSQVERIHGELADDARTIYLLLEQRITLNERLAQSQQTQPVAQDQQQQMALTRKRLDQRIANLLSRGDHIAGQLTPVISTLTSYILHDERQRLQALDDAVDSLLKIVIISGGALVALILTQGLLLNRRLVQRLHMLWLALRHWRGGLNAQALPSGADEIGHIARLSLEMHDTLRRKPHAPSLLPPPSPLGPTGILPAEQFIDALRMACREAAKQQSGSVWLFLLQTPFLKAQLSDLQDTQATRLCDHVVLRCCTLGGPEATAGRVDGETLGLILPDLTPTRARSLKEMFRTHFYENPVVLRSGEAIAVDVRVGYAQSNGLDPDGSADTLLAQADTDLISDRVSI